MADILLTTLNAKFIHAAFGLRYLLANMGDLRPRTALREFDINTRVLDIAEEILAEKPAILGIGVYIWNTSQVRELVRVLKGLQPSLWIVLGGPEVSHDSDKQELVALADFTVTGEADLAFADLCRRILAGEPPTKNVLHAPLPDVNMLQLPYPLYTDEDVANRIVYVEASRGCPFSCEFCLSSLDVPVRAFDTEKFLAAMQVLFERGVRHFKFVDRTFNLNLKTSGAILQFFLDRYTPGLFVHFEMVPDRLPEPLRQLIAKFPPGALQFEVGIQTFNPEVETRISRRQNHERLDDNLRWLRDASGVHVHADLIAGLPGETLVSFAAGFDRLIALGPQEIQVGILKRLKGTPITRHDAEWRMLYSDVPPFEILSTATMDFFELQQVRRFAKFWDIYGNSGNFPTALPLVWHEGQSPFYGFLTFSEWLHSERVMTHGIARVRQFELLHRYLTSRFPDSRQQHTAALLSDYHRAGHMEHPSWAGKRQEGSPSLRASRKVKPDSPSLPKRQGRHLQTQET